MGCGGKELIPQETMCPTFFSHILKSMNILLALSLFLIPCRPELTAKPLFYLKLFKACQKITYPAESESSWMIAGMHLLVTPSPGDHHHLSEIIMIVPEQLANCYNIWSFTVSS